jgi:hypothetical protein
MLLMIMMTTMMKMMMKEMMKEDDSMGSRPLDDAILYLRLYHRIICCRRLMDRNIKKLKN